MNIDRQDTAWQVWDGQYTQDWEAFNYAKDVVDGGGMMDYPAGNERRLIRPSSDFVEAGKRRLQSENDDGLDTVYFYYKAGGNIFNKDALHAICQFEKRVLWTLSDDEIARVANPEDYGEDGILWNSPVRLFYGVPQIAAPSDRQYPANFASHVECEELSESFIQATVQAIYQDVQVHLSSSVYAKYVHPQFAEGGDNLVTSTKIEAWEEIGSRLIEAAQDDLGLEYAPLQSAYQGDDDRHVDLGAGGVRIRLMFTGMDDFETMIGPDFGLAFFAFVFVFLVMYAYTFSLFIACFGMMQIVLSLPLSGLFYRGLFQISYFEFLHILVVYLVLGIGADDIFVLVDTFRHVDDEMRGSKPWTVETFRAVLKAAYLRSASAILNTSFTTAVAFLASSGSKAMPMRTCGWFAAICIVMNYVLTITFTPVVVSIWHTRFQAKGCCSCHNKGKCTPCDWSHRDRSDAAVADADADAVKQADEEPAGPRQSKVERALAKFYIPFMSYGFNVGCISLRPGSIFVIVVMIIVAVQGIINAAQLSPPRKAEVWFPDNHMAIEFSDYTSDVTFSPDHDNYAVIGIVWGIAGLDKGDLDVYKPDDFKGGTVYDSSFDLTRTEVQQHILDTCAAFRQLPCDKEACKNHGYAVRTLMMQSSQQTHACFMEDFRAYIQWRAATYPLEALSWPLPQQSFMRELARFRTDYYGDVDASGCCTYGAALERNYWEDIGFIDGELKYVHIRIRSTMQWDTAFGQGTDVRDLLEDWMDLDVRPNAPEGAGTIKFHAEGVFSSYDLGEELLNGLFQGCAIAAPIAFLVLLAATWNIIVSVYAVSCVGFVVLCVLGFCKSAMDWDLGVGEAIAGVIVLGYSVDYVVHLAHIYCEGGSHHGLQTRGERAEFAIKNMGSTVFAGAITTAGSAVVMFFCFFYFFFKMAVLITVTIMYAFLFSLGLLMALLWTVGPEGNFGNLAACCCCCSNQSTSEVDVVPTPKADSDGDNNDKMETQNQQEKATGNIISAFAEGTTA
eukprot:CAMPEP_0178392510 /NCGR_PEP_ID=MMETSP0689_2-20121128/11715_1 /TAXON_ID=160604 /ORGANISM="Amphidinium massartii, Strain CS-259" /LENGTH=1011 /DNA_ID=CAMNT_0020013085 /DNA_START=129 /DNA_END=3164 /DNA_ORIENTATION=-